MDKMIQEIKKFNRFYVRIMGIFSLYSDKSQFSATEAMILFEISNHQNCTATHLSNYFLLDKGYVSKIIRRFSKEGIITRITSSIDRRVQYIHLTNKGVEELKHLQERANQNVAEMIKDIPEENIKELIESMQRIEELLKVKDEEMV